MIDTTATMPRIGVEEPPEDDDRHHGDDDAAQPEARVPAKHRRLYGRELDEPPDPQG